MKSLDPDHSGVCVLHHRSPSGGQAEMGSEGGKGTWLDSEDMNVIISRALLGCGLRGLTGGRVQGTAMRGNPSEVLLLSQLQSP